MPPCTTIVALFRNHRLAALGLVCAGLGVVYVLLKRNSGQTIRPRDVHLISNASEMADLSLRLTEQAQNGGVLGMDCEWLAARKVALLQLCTTSRECYLIRLHLLPMEALCFVAGVLENNAVLKVGVGIHADSSRLLCDYGLACRGCVDLRDLVPLYAAKHRTDSLKRWGLEGLTAEFCGYKMSKSKDLTCSNWETCTLSKDQVRYAANDALAGINVFIELTGGRVKGMSLHLGIIDVAYKPRPRNMNKENKGPVRTKRIKQPQIYNPRGLHYSNCCLLAPDGDLLSLCSQKKLEWYIHNQLGVKVNDDPFTVKLNFEPSARAKGESKLYYLQPKEDICCVCGRDDSFVRKFVVPKEYRRYLPNEMKIHLSHDILLTCLDCHVQCDLHAEYLKATLAKECQAPRGSQKVIAKTYFDPSLRAIVSASRALLKCRDKIPFTRRMELEAMVAEHFQVEEASDDICQLAVNLNVKIHNDNFVEHGLVVVQHYLKSPGGLQSLESLWREHFISTMNPKYLPKLWSIRHNHNGPSVGDVV